MPNDDLDPPFEYEETDANSINKKDYDPTNDPKFIPGHEPGARPPFPPVWEGDVYAGHHTSCGVRVHSPCTCGMWELEQPGPPESPEPDGRALMPLAGEFLHGLLHLPDDVHIVGVSWDGLNVVLLLEAFSTNEFPSGRVTAKFHTQWNVLNSKIDTIFDGWESID